jgi:hypothetical protein
MNNSLPRDDRGPREGELAGEGSFSRAVGAAARARAGLR